MTTNDLKHAIVDTQEVRSLLLRAIGLLDLHRHHELERIAAALVGLRHELGQWAMGAEIAVHARSAA